MSSQGFFARVYELVARIPPGKVMTYGQIARVLESPYSAKLVGFAMSAAPEERGLPCHRVLNRLGEMAPGLIFGGERKQRQLLRSEGVPFLDNGRVDLTLALFEPPALCGL
ncbi:methylated-DNA--[protein]-cysteine S-methyltransferase [Desulfovibrio sp. OttesenSCG-928-A18]|nr:methylated-DNA--[protein]-cysteine S-methyltransferase [Desulfovibrio sp. OttesenSCG-928-A18]